MDLEDKSRNLQVKFLENDTQMMHDFDIFKRLLDAQKQIMALKDTTKCEFNATIETIPEIIAMGV